MSPRKRLLCRMWGILGGISFLLIGLLRGEGGEVFRKAVKVCLECIGIG